jgi:transposase
MRMKSHPQYFISKPRRSSRVGITIGIDLGDIWSHYCTLNEDGEVVDRGRFRTNPSGVDKRFRDLERVRVAMEIKVYGVGHLTALTFVLTLGKKERFERSRDVGCYLGLRPRRSQSGDSEPQLGITKAGNGYLRQLLVECANHVIGPHGKDSTLRRWGHSLGARGGSHARRRAVVAVARKLAVLLHRIWITQEVYVPFYEIAA